MATAEDRSVRPAVGTAASPRFIGSEIYRAPGYGAWHPLRVPRVSTVMDLARALGWLHPEQYIVSPTAKPAALHAWHHRDYVTALQTAEREQAVSAAVRRRHGLGTLSNPVFAEMYRRPATAAGASLLAGELLARPGVIHSPGGGTHHGLPDRANGFCYLNDPVLAILSLRRSGVRRIAYVDIDAHHPDGVECAFRHDPDILLVSIHEAGRWPRTGALQDRGVGNLFNLPVPAGLNDTEMSMILDRLILPAVDAHRSEAVILQCGADAIEEDPQSRLALSNRVHLAVVSELRPLSRRYLVLGGGGYNPWSVGRLWTGVWGRLTGRDIPDRLPGTAEAVLRKIRWQRRGRAKSPPDHWFTTLLDAPREGTLRDTLRDDLHSLTARLRIML